MYIIRIRTVLFFHMLLYLLFSIFCASCCTTVAFCWTGKLILSIRGVPSFTAQVLLVDHVCIAKLCIVACWHHVQSRGGKK